MSNRDLTLTAKLYADASRMMNGLLNGERGIKKFTNTAKREFESVKNSITSVEGKLASLGITVGVTASIMQSARLDKSLTQIGQTAGATDAAVKDLRGELFRMSQETGQGVDDLKQGFDNAVQAGLRFNEALPVIDATNKAMALTGANADSLTGSLTVASSAYHFDLANPELALLLLDKMTVAGRLGNAELENLSSIFSRVGPNAASAGIGFDQTLAFIEGLSQIERQPERLATLADSTLRLFNNLNYMNDAQKATGVKFFNKDGSRRDAMEVIADIKQQYDKIDTDAKRAIYIQKAFGQADLDTIKGMRVLLSGDMLNSVNNFSKEITGAGGTIERDLAKAISNAVDQVGRLKAELRQAGDNLAQPINDSIQKATKFALDSKENGGLGMDGKDIIAAGVGGTLATVLAAKMGGKAFSKIAGKVTGIGTGVATGKALETAAGVTPVYVVNMSEAGFGGGLPDSKSKAGGLAKYGKYGAGLGIFGLQGLAVGAAGLAGMGYGKYYNKGINKIDSTLGTEIGNHIGRTVAIVLSPFSQVARDSIRNEFSVKAAELKGTLRIKIDKDGNVTSSSLESNQSKLNTIMDNGPNMVYAL